MAAASLPESRRHASPASASPGARVCAPAVVCVLGFRWLGRLGVLPSPPCASVPLGMSCASRRPLQLLWWTSGVMRSVPTRSPTRCLQRGTSVSVEERSHWWQPPPCRCLWGGSYPPQPHQRTHPLLTSSFSERCHARGALPTARPLRNRKCCPRRLGCADVSVRPPLLVAALALGH